MSLNLNIDGIDIFLNIDNYEKSNRHKWDYQWCKCDFKFSSDKWLNYHKQNYEPLLSCEIEELESKLTMLINGDFKEEKELSFIEPDFEFLLYPKKETSNTVIDIYLEWKVFFWHIGLTSNYLSVTLDRSEITQLRDYLSSVIKEN